MNIVKLRYHTNFCDGDQTKTIRYLYTSLDRKLVLLKLKNGYYKYYQPNSLLMWCKDSREWLVFDENKVRFD